MKKSIIIGSLILAALLLSGCGKKPSNQNNPDQLAIEDTETPIAQQPIYCYNTKMGTKLYNGIPNKFCLCEGEEIHSANCPIGAACDSSTVYCKGQIMGFKFGYGWGDNKKEFDTLEKWEYFCDTGEKEKGECLSMLNYTKSKLELSTEEVEKEKFCASNNECASGVCNFIKQETGECEPDVCETGAQVQDASGNIAFFCNQARTWKKIKNLGENCDSDYECFRKTGKDCPSCHLEDYKYHCKKNICVEEKIQNECEAQGLKRITSKEDADSANDGSCRPTVAQRPEKTVCSPCGNGTCEHELESACNCSEDCEKKEMTKEENFCIENSGQLGELTECDEKLKTCILEDRTVCPLDAFFAGECEKGVIVEWGEQCR